MHGLSPVQGSLPPDARVLGPQEHGCQLCVARLALRRRLPEAGLSSPCARGSAFVAAAASRSSLLSRPVALATALTATHAVPWKGAGWEKTGLPIHPTGAARLIQQEGPRLINIFILIYDLFSRS